MANIQQAGPVLSITEKIHTENRWRKGIPERSGLIEKKSGGGGIKKDVRRKK